MKKVFLAMIRFYQNAISPYTRPKCKFYPTCSQYGLEAIERFGAFKGLFMTLWRVLRCNPFSHGGYDPVPQKKERDTNKQKGNSI